MRFSKFIIILSLCFLANYTVEAVGIVKSTGQYAIKGTDTLYWDKYDVENYKLIETKRPCIIFAFGGGFFAGARDTKHYIPFFEKMVEEGYVVVSIDYRLGLKDLDVTKVESPLDIISLLAQTINHAVEDVYDATNVVIFQAEEWGINKDMIVVAGSSAGAITALHAEYELCNETERAKILPSEFRYAGVISFAGAILSLDGDLKWKRLPAPIQFFHGDCDGNVPYDKLELFNLGFYGSKHIAEHFRKREYAHYFYDVGNANHSIADSPMKDNLLEIQSFMIDFVKNGKPIWIHSKVKINDKPFLKKDHTILDFILNNFS